LGRNRVDLITLGRNRVDLVTLGRNRVDLITLGRNRVDLITMGNSSAGSRSQYSFNRMVPMLGIYWRASLVPAAAVIPASIAYINTVTVKKLVVGSF